MKKYIFILLISTPGFNSCIEEPAPCSNSVRGNFDALWHIIDTRYCFLDYKDIDWNDVYDRYQLRLNTVSNKFELFDLCKEMLNELEDGHVNLSSDFDVSNNRRIFSDSIKNFYSDIIFSDNYLGENFRSIGGLHYKKINNGRIGYVYYNSFSNTFSDQHIRNIFDLFSDCDGLIIDVRNNGGGFLNLSEKLASYFFEQETVTGYMIHKTGNGHSDFSRPTEIRTPTHSTIYWEKPVAVLTNRGCYSATNDFVNRMKLAPSAFSVGSWTGGGSGLPFSSELPIGWSIRFSASPMLDANMNHTEFGIAPDYYIAITDSDKGNDIDTVIEKAVSIIIEK